MRDVVFAADVVEFVAEPAPDVVEFAAEPEAEPRPPLTFRGLIEGRGARVTAECFINASVLARVLHVGRQAREFLAHVAAFRHGRHLARERGQGQELGPAQAPEPSTGAPKAPLEAPLKTHTKGLA